MLIWKGKGFKNQKVACIASGIDRESSNRKTGKMLQLWIVPEKLNYSKNEGVCGSCPLAGNGCYVRIAWAVRSVHKRLNNLKLPSWNEIKNKFEGKLTRFGAYGEPVLLPLKLVKKIAKISKGFTGYTHAWSIKKYNPYKKYFMASVESLADAQKAWKNGWHTFRIVRSIEEKTSLEIVCPATPYYLAKTGKKIQCTDCMICCGQASKSPKSVVIVAHGSTATLKNVRQHLEEMNELAV